MFGGDKASSFSGNNQQIGGNGANGIGVRPRFDDERRLAALKRYEIVDSVSEIAFDDLAALAAQICATPIALVSLVDAHRLWFKSRVGFEHAEIPRQHTFCAEAIFDPLNITQVRDAALDDRFSASPYVLGAPHMRFYAGAPLVTPEGHALGTICVIDSVPRALNEAQCHALEALSRQVMAQLELRRNISGLRSTIGELARAQRDLSHVRTSVTRAKQSRSRFLANIVSEISEPLTSLLGAAQALQAGESQQRVQQILAGGSALQEVVTHLATLSAIDNRSALVQPTHQLLRPFLNEIITSDVIAQSLAQEKVSIVISVAANVPEAIAIDAPKVAQILTSLLENAIKFAKPQTVVGVDVAYFSEKVNRAVGGDSLRISVRDDGDIIAQNQLDAVFFDLVNSVERSARRAGERVLKTGLNVSAAKSLANLMDGDIVVHSTAEMGTQFVLSLPLVPVAHAVNPMATANVLVAEDDEISRKVAGMMLRKRGIEARLVKNGAEAVAEALKSKPDLMLMDFHMPHMNGIEAMREIRAQPGFENLPVVIMSADAQAMEHQALVVGASAVITKPIDLVKLDPILQRFLRVASVAQG